MNESCNKSARFYKTEVGNPVNLVKLNICSSYWGFVFYENMLVLNNYYAYLAWNKGHLIQFYNLKHSRNKIGDDKNVEKNAKKKINFAISFLYIGKAQAHMCSLNAAATALTKNIEI